MKNGVVVLEAGSLEEGQAVRVEPIEPGTQSPLDSERAARVRRLQQRFAEWTEEDGRLTDEEADRLRAALDQHRGVRFRSPPLD